MRHVCSHLSFAAVVLVVLASGGCTTAPKSEAADAPRVPADQVHPDVAAAADQVDVMTLPTVETAWCFPQRLVRVRRAGGTIRTADVLLYEDRRLDQAYHRVVFMDGERFGYCTPLGEVVIPPRFDEAQPFQEGIAVVRSGEKYGYIDPFGEWLVPPDLEFAYGFWHGVGAAKSGGKFGLVGHAGQWITPPTFAYMAAVGGGITARTVEDEEGFLDVRGNFIKSGPLSRFYHPPKKKP